MWQIEVTDTFGGAANYCWVRRYTMPSKEGEKDAQVMRRAKATAGYTNVRGRSASFGDCLEFRPYRQCVVMFVTWIEDDAAAQGIDDIAHSLHAGIAGGF